MLSGFVESQMMAGQEKKEQKKEDQEKSQDGHNVLQEALNNIRIVKSCNAEDHLEKRYQEKTEQQRKKALKQGIFFSLLLGISQMMQFIIYAVVFLIGAVFIRDGKMDF